MVTLLVFCYQNLTHLESVMYLVRYSDWAHNPSLMFDHGASWSQSRAVMIDRYTKQSNNPCIQESPNALEVYVPDTFLVNQRTVPTA